MSIAQLQPLSTYVEYPVEEMKERATAFRKQMQRRRTVRQFSERPVPRAIIEECLIAAGTAPNGANLQPWQFVVISDPKVKREIRIAAEEEEWEFYHRRAPRGWQWIWLARRGDAGRRATGAANEDKRMRQVFNPVSSVFVCPPFVCQFLLFRIRRSPFVCSYFKPPHERSLEDSRTRAWHGTLFPSGLIVEEAA